MEQQQGNLNYSEGCSMQRPPLLESDGFCYWKQRFEIYNCAKDIDLLDRIENGDYITTQFSDAQKKNILVKKESWTQEQKTFVSKILKLNLNYIMFF